MCPFDDPAAAEAERKNAELKEWKVELEAINPNHAKKVRRSFYY
jgi:hypothetical protein